MFSSSLKRLLVIYIVLYGVVQRYIKIKQNFSKYLPGMKTRFLRHARPICAFLRIEFDQGLTFYINNYF